MPTYTVTICDHCGEKAEGRAGKLLRLTDGAQDLGLQVKDFCSEACLRAYVLQTYPRDSD